MIESGLSQAFQPEPRVNLTAENAGRGLASLALTLIRALHELLERQAVRRMERGELSDDQIDELGKVFFAQMQEIERLKELFSLSDEDLNLDLGPLGKLI